MCLFGRQSITDWTGTKAGKIFYHLVHTPNGQSNWGWVWLKPGASNLTWVSHMAVVAQLLEPSFTALPVALAQSWIKTKQPGLTSVTSSPPHYHTDPTSLLYNNYHITWASITTQVSKITYLHLCYLAIFKFTLTNLNFFSSDHQTSCKLPAFSVHKVWENIPMDINLYTQKHKL